MTTTTTTTMFKCAHPKCPGYGWAASEMRHPANTCGPGVCEQCGELDECEHRGQATQQPANPPLRAGWRKVPESEWPDDHRNERHPSCPLIELYEHERGARVVLGKDSVRTAPTFSYALPPYTHWGFYHHAPHQTLEAVMARAEELCPADERAPVAAAAPAPAAPAVPEGFRVLPEEYNGKPRFTCRADLRYFACGIVYWGFCAEGWRAYGDRHAHAFGDDLPAACALARELYEQERAASKPEAQPAEVPTQMSLAQAAYEAWDREAREHVGACPPWADLPAVIKNAWNAALERAFVLAEERESAASAQPVSGADGLPCALCVHGTRTEGCVVCEAIRLRKANADLEARIRDTAACAECRMSAINARIDELERELGIQHDAATWAEVDRDAARNERDAANARIAELERANAELREANGETIRGHLAMLEDARRHDWWATYRAALTGVFATPWHPDMGVDWRTTAEERHRCAAEAADLAHGPLDTTTQAPAPGTTGA